MTNDDLEAKAREIVKRFIPDDKNYMGLDGPCGKVISLEQAIADALKAEREAASRLPTQIERIAKIAKIAVPELRNMISRTKAMEMMSKYDDWLRELSPAPEKPLTKQTKEK